MNRELALFESTHAVIRAERLCIAHQLSCRAVAVPRSISSECGIGLEIPEDLKTAVHELMTRSNITVSWRRLQ